MNIYFQGVYVINGLDLTDIMSSFNFPKKFYYGSYKARVSGKDKYNNSIFCIMFIADIKRPWETE